VTRPADWDVTVELAEIAATIDELRAYASLPASWVFGLQLNDATFEIVRINATLKRIAQRAKENTP
jgi:hypothetical protein